jgi:hypothetical protein
MDDAKCNGLERLRQLLMFAVEDLQQARAAAIALRDEHDDVELMRALETAIVVCYGRAFTANDGWGQLPKKHWPPQGPERDLHDALLHLRNKTYAHVSDESGRDVAWPLTQYDSASETASIEFVVSWLALDRGVLPSITGLCTRQADHFQVAAEQIHLELEGFKGLGD